MKEFCDIFSSKSIKTKSANEESKKQIFSSGYNCSVIKGGRVRISEEKTPKEKTPKPKKNAPTIIIDYRERNSLVPAKLIGMGFNINFKELKVADYIVGETAIERKEAKDFISSMINKRLSRQLEEIKQYENRLIIIEGNIYASNINRNAINGFILSILTYHKTPIFFTRNDEETANIIKILANKKQKESTINPSKKILSPKKRAQFILEGFEGIGPKTAKKLLEKFGSLINIFNAGRGELDKILSKQKMTNILERIFLFK